MTIPHRRPGRPENSRSQPGCYHHQPVLSSAVWEYLAPQPGQVVVDCTVGQAGHARTILERIGPHGLLIGLDVDAAILSDAEKRLKPLGPPFRLVRRSYVELIEVLAELGLTAAHAILADLGASSVQLDDPQRGFSFQQDGPLDMRMDDRLTVRAADLVNTTAEPELADLIFRWGQEPLSRKVARAICRGRLEHRLDSTAELARIVCVALGVDPAARPRRIHPATRTFQALRIAVNHELENLQALLRILPAALEPGGRAVIISFHSLEDRLVKTSFRQAGQDGLLEVLTARPITPDAGQIRANPRSRSARLRAARRTDKPVGPA